MQLKTAIFIPDTATDEERSKKYILEEATALKIVETWIIPQQHPAIISWEIELQNSIQAISRKASATLLTPVIAARFIDLYPQFHERVSARQQRHLNRPVLDIIEGVSANFSGGFFRDMALTVTGDDPQASSRIRHSLITAGIGESYVQFTKLYNNQHPSKT